MSHGMVSNQEELKTAIEDKLILPKQLDNFHRKRYEIVQNREKLAQFGSSFRGESSRQKLPAKVVKTELDQSFR